MEPHVSAGIPLYSNPQTGLFSPFNVPLWILPLTYGIGVAAASKLLAGGFGTYLLVRQLRLGLLPGLLAGVAFPFAAINIVWLAHETLPAVVVHAAVDAVAGRADLRARPARAARSGWRSRSPSRSAAATRGCRCT